MKTIYTSILITILMTTAYAQQDNIHQQSTVYEWPEDPLVLKKLEQWQDQKFGIIIHWGLYAVPGMIESWALCNEDWISRPDSLSYCEFKEWYWGLKDDFNPVNFDPVQWAKAAREAGMRYLVFTTKHHDGFSMFDTKQSNFNIASGPFASNPKADVAKHVFDAFRNEGFMIGAYFSKPDWHTENYWWPKYATPDRNVNYDIRKHLLQYDDGMNQQRFDDAFDPDAAFDHPRVERVPPQVVQPVHVQLAGYELVEEGSFVRPVEDRHGPVQHAAKALVQRHQ